ncbi:MAG: hypothetical protein K8R59_00855, partial [Thermoanaerobaculales bacterium]|nr:hypothetical protein [Thermoanaerobaculales bacterium]
MMNNRSEPVSGEGARRGRTVVPTLGLTLIIAVAVFPNTGGAGVSLNPPSGETGSYPVAQAQGRLVNAGGARGHMDSPGGMVVADHREETGPGTPKVKPNAAGAVYGSPFRPVAGMARGGKAVDPVTLDSLTKTG